MNKKLKKYLVGGAVRDMLLHKASTDNDFVVVGETIESMQSMGFKLINEKTPNVPVLIHPETKEEFALARKEIKVGEGKSGFVMDFNTSITIEEDLYRRDLTINAIAYNQETNEFIDPFNGVQDLENKILRAVSINFKEDPTRILRLAYFMAKFPEFNIDPLTLEYCKEMALSSEFKSIKSGSLLPILKKILTSNKPSRAFYFLKEINALNFIFPEIGILEGIPQNPLYHPEGCVFTHVMLVLDNARLLANENIFEICFASLVHDLGKGITPNEILPSHRGHEESGVELIKNFCQKYQIGGQAKKLALLVCRHHLTIHRALELNPSRVVQLFNETNATKDLETFRQALLCCKADNLGKLHEEYRQEKYLLEAIEELKKVHFKKELNQELATSKFHEDKVLILKAFKRNWNNI